MCSLVGALQVIEFFLKIADFSVIVNISVKIKFEVMQMLLWPMRLDENKSLTKIFTQRYITKKSGNVDQFCGIYGNGGTRKYSTSPFQKLKFVAKAFLLDSSLLTFLFHIFIFIFIPHQLSNLFLVMWSQCFQNNFFRKIKLKKTFAKKQTFTCSNAPAEAPERSMKSV